MLNYQRVNTTVGDMFHPKYWGHLGHPLGVLWWIPDIEKVQKILMAWGEYVETQPYTKGFLAHSWQCQEKPIYIYMHEYVMI